MKLSFKRFVYPVLLAVLLAASAGAITPRQLVAPFFLEEDHVALGGSDLRALLNDPRPLSQIAAKIALPLAREGALQPAVKDCLDRVGAFVFHNGVKTEEGEHRELIVAAEVLGDLPEAPRDAGFTIPDEIEGATLTPVGVYTVNGQKAYCAFLSRDGQNFIVAAKNDPSLLSVMASVPSDIQAEPVPASPLWLSGYTPPSKLSQLFKKGVLPEGLTKALRFTVALDQTERSIRAHVWSNLGEIITRDEVPVSGERPFLTGSETVYGLLSFEGLYNALGEHRDTIAKALTVAGLSEEEIASVLSRRVTVGAAGKSSSLFGSFPGCYVHLAGASRATAEKLVSLVKLAASQKSTKVAPFSQGSWRGVSMTKWMFTAFAAASDQGFIIAFQDTKELGRTPRPAPEIARLLAENHAFLLCLDTQALADKLDSGLGMLGSLFLNDEQQRQIETALKTLEAFGVFTLTANSVEESDAELFVNEPAFGRLIDNLSARVMIAAPVQPLPIAPPAVVVPVSPDMSAPNATVPPESVQPLVPNLEMTMFLRAAGQFKKLFPAASIVPHNYLATALYDGKPVTMTVTKIPDEDAQLRFVSAVRNSALNIGPERAERAARQWRENNPSSPCELTSERKGDTTEIELSLIAPYSEAVSDAEFVKTADQFLAALDSFYDLSGR